MSRTVVFVFCLLVGLNCQRLRIRHPGEIVPANVEKSDTTETGVGDGSSAVDLDFHTSAYARRTNVSKSWLKLTFDKLYCISLVNRFNDDATVRQSYTCRNAACNCAGDQCRFMKELSVESNSKNKYSVRHKPDCKYGNSVKMQVNSEVSFPIYEVAVFGTVVCPAGSYRISEEECESCPDDEYSEAGAATCTKCPPGAAVNENRTKCEMCKAGTFKKSDRVNCAECSGNSVSAIGAAYCVLCSPGTLTNENKTLCVPESSTKKNKTQCDHGIIIEPILWGLLGLFVLTSAILGILLARKCNTYNTEDEHGYINREPAPKNENAALKPRPTSEQVPVHLPPAPASAVPESRDNLELDYINMNSIPIYEELN